MKIIPSKYKIHEQRVSVRKIIKAAGRNIHKDGECKIYIEILAIQKDGKKHARLIDTNLKVNPKNWDSKTWDGQVKKKDPDYEHKNAILDEKYYLYCYQIQQRAKGEMVEGSPGQGLPSIDEMFPKVQKTLVQYLDEYIKYRKSTDAAANTIKSFGTLKYRLEEYQNENNIKLRFEDINLVFSDNFHAWMLKKDYNSSTIGKTYTLLITFLGYYWDRRDEINTGITDKFKNKRFRRGNTKGFNEAHPLSYEEWNILINHKFDNPHLELTKKRFMLAVSTGMRYSDLFNIKPENIIDGKIVYHPVKTRNKVNNVAQPPLNPISEGILKECGYDTTKIYVSNQKYNDALEDMWKELNKHHDNKFGFYTSHDARDTFITFMLLEGVDVPTLLKMTGQESWLEMRKYAKIFSQHMNDSMAKVKIFS